MVDILKEFSRIIDEVFKSGKPTAYVLYSREPWRGNILEEDSKYLDGAGVQTVITKLNGALKSLSAEGYETKKIEDNLSKESYEVRILNDGKIAEIKISDDLYVTYALPTLTKKEIREYMKSRDVILPMGLPNIFALAGVQYHGDKYDFPYKIGDMERVMDEKETLPIIWDYPLAVKENFEKSPKDKFKEVHGIEDYRDVTHKEMLKIGRSPDSKEAGIQPLNWKLWDQEKGDHILEVTALQNVDRKIVGFNAGIDGALIYTQPGIRMVVGGRGASSQIGNALLEGKEIDIKNLDETAKELLKEYENLSDGEGMVIALKTTLLHGKPEEICRVLGVYEVDPLRF
ncbi:MAG: hypothetical protein J7L43_01650 [Candidatus Aenigmarchaeota archaeon]|nr:hypothetical protein [Candidatus Aenigmarchaeota archaeon]